MKTVSHTFKTKLDKSSDAHTTIGTFDFTGVTDAQIEMLVMRPVVIMQQSVYRTVGKVPPTDTVNVAELLKRQPGGFQITPESIAKRAGADRGMYEKTLAALGIDQAQIKKLADEKFNAK